MIDKYKLLNDFLQAWPIDRLKNMSIEEYTNLNKSDSFCYWLEQRTNELGGISGGSSFKFGIYRRNNTEKEISTSNGLTDSEYAWFYKYGQTRDEAFQKVKDIIVKIAEFATNKEFDRIEEIDLGETTKWKIAFMYSDFKLINTFSKDMVCSILDFLQIDYSYDESRFSLSNKILSQKNEKEDFFEYGSRFWNETLISQGLKKVLIKLDNRVFPYFEILDRIVENFNLEPNNEKYYFSYNSKELIFTIGQRYIWTLTKNEYKYISLTKNEEIAETFGRENQEPEAYLNYSKNPANFSTILDGMLICINDELKDTNKASHRNKNKKDLQELVFNKEFRNKIFMDFFNNKRNLFIQWLNNQFGEKNGTNNSYVRAIDILSELLNVDLFKISETEYFKNLYQDLILNQKNESGKYYYEKSKSYGEKGFYSASIQMYINFLSIENNIINEPNILYKIMNSKTSLNQILYGPPGTGKTYNTINKAIEIANPEFDLNQDRNIIKTEYERLVNQGQIVFTTFHQSMTYEDFIEGIKPYTKNENVTYSVKDGVFKSIVKKSLTEYIKNNAVSGEGIDDFDTLFASYIDSLKPFEGKREGIFTTKTGIELMLMEANSKAIQVKYLWNNNKTKDTEAHHKFSVSKEKLKKVLLEGIEPAKVKNLLAELHPLIGHIHCELFAVYKSLYEYVITNKGELEAVHFNYDDQSFEEIKEQFDSFSKESLKDVNIENYVLIIDEINRGNVSQIFGELITLIEEDKRLGNDEALEITLPYSKEKFGVPSNLHIIGTMNTADRSVEALDTALRRRFVFEEMPPKYDLDNLQQNLFGYSASSILETINKRIEKLLDRDHLIGHAYFINKNETTIIDSLYKNIIPLLQEYFFGDYEKIGLVLGRGFIQKIEQDSAFANFDHLDYSQFEEKESYEIINHRNNFTSFSEAIQLLMNR